MANQQRQRRRERRQERRQTQAAETLKIQQPSAPVRQAANTSSSQYGGNINRALDFTQNRSAVMGQAAVDRALAGGMSAQDLRNAAFYGRFQLGDKAYQSLFGGGERASNTMGGRTIRTNEGTVSNVSGYGTENWGADTLANMQQRRQQYQQMRGAGNDIAAISQAFAQMGYQPGESFNRLGDQRWYSRPVTNDMKIAAYQAALRDAPQNSPARPIFTNILQQLGIAPTLTV
jgi:hypothetical protein